jgi:PAP2 superfamily
MLRFLFLSLLFISSSAVQAEEYTFSDRHIYPVLKRSTDLHSGMTFLSGALASLVARPNDDHVRAEWKGEPKISEKDAQAGDLIGTGAVSALVIGAQYMWDPNESMYQSHLRGFIYGGVGIYTLKTAFGRNRPGDSHSHQAFPSGHTAITFMTATHLAYAYGWKAAVIAFPVAVFTGASRLADDAHWFSDTVGGAFLGYFVGRATFYDRTAWENPTVASVQYQLIPVVQRDLSGVSLHVSY